MKITWYPGHMHKASKELVKVMRNTQVVLEVLDARIPLSSSNPALADIRQKLPCIKVLNKADMADEETTRRWQAWFEQDDNVRCLISGRDSPLSKDRVLHAADTLIKDSGRAADTRNQMVIVGIPNVGKSTLLNKLAERKLAKTGNEPAVTQAQQRIRLSERWYLIDTPGLMWPRLEDQDGAYKMAMTGAIRNTAIESDDIAWFAAEFLQRNFQETMADRYQVDTSISEAEQVMEAIAAARGSYGRGGKPDWNKTAEILLNDFRSGKLGKLSLESPPGE